MRWIGDALWLAAAAIAYSVYAPIIAVYDAVPILTMIVVVRVALTSGALAGNISGFFCGLLLDVTTPEWFGAAMLIGSIIGYVTGIMRDRIVLDCPIARFIVLFVAVTIHSLGIMFIRNIITPGIAPESIMIVLLSGVYTAFLGGMWWTLTGVARAFVGWRSIWYVERQ